MGSNLQQLYTPGVQAMEEPIKAVATMINGVFEVHDGTVNGYDVRRSVFSTIRSQGKPPLIDE
jgi:hypothetical protein